VNDVTIALGSLAATTALGAAIGASLRPGDRVLLSGDLGSGKTTLARAIGVALHAEPELTSPTFVLVSEHHGDLPIWHVDAYRLPVGSDALRAGVIDERQQRGVTLIEWPEHLEGLGAEGADVLGIHLAAGDGDGARTAVIRGARADLRAVLDAAFDTSEGDRG
jgi:tRNA threonylcarbamoyladenosine biosynthesis protein TsaE